MHTRVCTLSREEPWLFAANSLSFALTHNTHERLHSHTRNTLSGNYGQTVRRFTVQKTGSGYRSCINLAYTSAIRTLKIHWQPAISHYFKKPKAELREKKNVAGLKIWSLHKLFAWGLHSKKHIIQLWLSVVPQRSVPSSLESCTHACRPLSQIISTPLTKECLNCIMCQAGGLAAAYFAAPCLRLRWNREQLHLRMSPSAAGLPS